MFKPQPLSALPSNTPSTLGGRVVVRSDDRTLWRGVVQKRWVTLHQERGRGLSQETRDTGSDHLWGLRPDTTRTGSLTQVPEFILRTQPSPRTERNTICWEAPVVNEAWKFQVWRKLFKKHSMKEHPSKITVETWGVIYSTERLSSSRNVQFIRWIC